MVKGQSALDFLMTYGWALLLIVLAVGALFALGVFNTGSFVGARAVGFTQIGVSAWRVNGSGNFTVQLANRAGTDVNVTNITSTYLGNTFVTNQTVSISNGATSATLAIANMTGVTAGATYSVPMSIIYVDRLTGFVYQTSGTLTGIVG
ncbi:Uncharacterised protein [uncultured archaeon]|nr:Uncharacterised protein [uncultured archaeon]